MELGVVVVRRCGEVCGDPIGHGGLRPQRVDHVVHHVEWSGHRRLGVLEFRQVVVSMDRRATG